MSARNYVFYISMLFLSFFSVLVYQVYDLVIEITQNRQLNKLFFGEICQCQCNCKFIQRMNTKPLMTTKTG